MAEKNSLQEIKRALNTNEVKSRLDDILGEKAPQFAASIVNAVSTNPNMQRCNPSSIMAAAFIAASLDLPIDPNLGRSYVIPYGTQAQFQMGYKGFVELAIRTGQYREMNSVEVYEDEIVEYNPILGKLRFVSDFNATTQRNEGDEKKIVGFYAYYELLTGFSKGLYMTREQVVNHAKKYSKTYNNGPWQTNFVAMAKKTVLKLLLSRWAILSVQMQEAINNDQSVFDGTESVYADNPATQTAQSDPVDALGESVVSEMLAQTEQAAPAEKKPEAKKQAAKQESAKQAEPQPAPENFADEFAAFDAQFEQDELPFH